MDLEDQFRQAVRRAYAAAGLRPSRYEIESLAGTYARWAGEADHGVVERLERKLTSLLAHRLHS